MQFAMAFRCSWSDDELIAMVDCEPTRMSRESMSSSSDESYPEMGLRTFQPAVDVEKGASCEPTLPIPAKTYYEPLMYLSDIRMMASCEPTLMSEEAYYEPTLMTPLPIPVEPEIEMITNITYSKKAELQFDQRKSLSDVESSWFHAKSKSAPAVMAAQIPNSEKSDLASATYPDVDKLKITRTFSAPIPSATKKEQRMSAADHVDNTMKTEGEIWQRYIAYLLDRLLGILDVPLVIVFGIILYVVDVGSDIMAAVVYFQEGHRIWGSLTITFVVLAAFCWAAVSWTWWYDDDKKDQHRIYRRVRIVLVVLLLDPLVR